MLIDTLIQACRAAPGRRGADRGVGGRSGSSLRFVAGDGSVTDPRRVCVLATFLITSGYFILFEIIWNGQTPGKRLLGVRVIRENGLSHSAGRLGDPQPGAHRRLAAGRATPSACW